MQVILIKNNSLRKKTLPEIATGNFWITDLDENGNEKNLINIQEIDGKWNLISNLDIYYVKNGKKVPSVILSEYNFYSLKNKNTYMYLYCCPTIDAESKYFDITNIGQEITIGKNQNNNIFYNFSFIEEIEAKIIVKGTYITITPNQASKLGVFVNDCRILSTTTLKNGDYIFIDGLKIIYANLSNRQVLIVNLVDSRVKVNLTETMRIIASNEFTKEENSEESNPIEINYFHKRPRFTQVQREYQVSIDPPPAANGENKTPLILVIGPMLTTSMMSFMYGYRAFEQLKNNNGNMSSAIMSIVMCVSMLAGTLLWPNITRRYAKKKRKEYEKLRHQKYGDYINQKADEIKKELINQKQILLDNNPNINKSITTILNKTNDLWQRRVEDNDFLTVTLGYGVIPMSINIKYPEEHFSMEEDDLKNLVNKLGSEEKNLVNVPITFSLRNSNILALIGQKQINLNFIKNILIQLIAFHSYDNLKIVLLTNEENKFYWDDLKALPHLFNNEKNFRYYGTNTEEYKEILYQLDSILTKRKEEKPNEEKLYNPHYLIITDCFKSIRNFEVINQLFENSKLGFSMIILNDKISTLPDRCQDFISLNMNSGELFKTILNNQSKKFNIEQVPIDLEKCVKTLADIPIEFTSTKEGQMPNKVSFLEMYNVGKIEQLNIDNRWKTSNPMLSLNAPVGIGKSGEKVSLDLHEKYHGPHGLVAGMTGSGKSEFLITYILSMAINYHPYEVQFILIDYKGGGLAGAFENQTTGIKLPHLVGTITNLDKNEIKRSLSSIESELKRRQKVFNTARELSGESTIDIYKYQKMYRNGIVKEPVSHLFIISDEFAELKNQEPEFMEQLISAARIGRSLGVHLILATQKPSGVVNAQIWSNTKFRVCLRVQDKSDSNEVIKCPDAAFLTQTGRFYLQVGQNEIFTIGQASYCGSPYIPSEIIQKQIDTSINVLNNNAVSIRNLEEDKKEVKVINQGEELGNIVSYLDKKAEEENIHCKPLWMPKIPELIFIEAIKKKYSYKPTPYVFNPVIGLYDDPNNQHQDLATINLTENGNTIIYGMSGSGDVLILGTLIYSLAIEHTPNEVNIYAIDCASETLTMYKNFPHVGDVALINDTEKITNLFKLIEEEMQTRKKLFVEYNGEYNYYCKNSGKQLPAIVLIISGYDAFKETYEIYEDVLKTISRDCIKYGIYIVISATGSNSVRSTVKQNFNNLVTLQLTDETAYSYIFGNIKKLTPSPLFGRGLIKIDQVYEFQTAHVINDERQLEYIKELTNRLQQIYPNIKAKKVPILPEIVTIKELLNNNSTLDNLPIGINKETLDVVTYDFIQDKIQMFITEEIEVLSERITPYIKLFSNFSKVIVIDAEKIVPQTNNYILINDKIEEQLDNLLNITPNNGNYLCILIGLNSIIKKLSTVSKKKFTDLLKKQTEDNSPIHFVLFTTLDMVKGLEFEPWYKEYINNTSGIFIGNGIDNQSILKAENSYKLSKIKLTNNFAFVIKKSNVSLVKLIEE